MVEAGRVTITGERESSKEEKKGKMVRAESRSDQILRIVDLPVEIDADKVTAMLKNGVLELTLPGGKSAACAHPSQGRLNLNRRASLLTSGMKGVDHGLARSHCLPKKRTQRDAATRE